MAVVNVPYIAQRYLDGQASQMATNRLLSGAWVRQDGTFVPRGSTVLIANLTAISPGASRVYLSGTGVDPTAITDAQVSATVYSFSPAVKVKHTQRTNLLNNNVVGATLESYVADGFAAQVRMRLAEDLMTAVKAVTGSTVRDITAEVAPGDVISRDELFKVAELFGDDDDAIATWLMHSETLSKVERMIASGSGLPYFTRQNGVLYVREKPVVPIDVGTKNSGPTSYNTFLLKTDAVAVGTNQPEDIREIPYAASTADGEGGFIYETDIHFYIHPFAKRPGTDRSGVAKLKHHI